MSFGAPQMSVLAVVLPGLVLILFWIGSRNRQQRLQAWAEPQTAERLAAHLWPAGRILRNALLCLALALLGLALTRPQWGYHYEEIQRRGIDLALVIDVSESMRAEDVSPSRLERAKRELSDFLDIVGGDRVALVATAGTSFIQCPLTLDYGALRSFISLIDTDLIPTPGTDLSAALQTAAKALGSSGPTRARAIILISDGGNLEGDPLGVARTLQEQGITIYTVGIGDPETGVPIPLAEGGYKEYDGKLITTKLEEETLNNIASTGQGMYVRAVTGDLDLEAIHQHIRESHTEEELGASQRKVYHERFVWPLSLALACLALEVCVPTRRHIKSLVGLGTLLTVLPTTAFADVTRDASKGIAAYEQGEFEAARDTFLRVRDQEPENARALLNLGAAEYKSGNLTDAAELFTAAAARAEDPALRAQSYHNAGNAYAQERQFDKAVESYESSLRIDPTQTDTKANLELVRKLIEEHEQQQEQRDEEQQKQQEQQQEQQENDEGDNANDNQREQEPDDSDDQSQENQSEQPGDEQQNDSPPSSDQSSPQESEQSQDQSSPEEPSSGDEQPQPTGEDQQSAEAETNAAPAHGQMTEEEADQWLRQLPDEESDALKRFWQGQQVQPSSPPKRDW